MLVLVCRKCFTYIHMLCVRTCVWAALLHSAHIHLSGKLLKWIGAHDHTYTTASNILYFVCAFSFLFHVLFLLFYSFTLIAVVYLYASRTVLTLRNIPKYYTTAQAAYTCFKAMFLLNICIYLLHEYEWSVVLSSSPFTHYSFEHIFFVFSCALFLYLSPSFHFSSRSGKWIFLPFAFKSRAFMYGELTHSHTHTHKHSTISRVL